LLPTEAPPPGATAQFPKTDFDKHSVPYAEILSGGPPRDGIPAIDDPKVVSIDKADRWLGDVEPVILVDIDGQARAYPLQILTWHEIVNDTLAGVPVAVTFCPLCNTAIAFERRLDGGSAAFTFGTTGRLRYSNLVMYDRQSESWWQQATGEAIAGEHTGRRLKTLPATIVGWETFKTTYPEGSVLSRDTGHSRTYGQNPYAGYDDVNRSPFLYRGPQTPGQLLPMERVATVELDGEAVAYPYRALEEQRVVNDTVGGKPVAVFWQAGTASALDSSDIAQGRDVGTISTLSRELDRPGESSPLVLSFAVENDRFIDEQTGSTWTLLGNAVDGPLSGEQLDAIVHINHFWFSWAAFRPETRVFQGEQQAVELDPAPVADAPGGGAPTAFSGYDFDVDLYLGMAQFGREAIQFSDAFAAGKPVVAVFYAGLCPFCRFEMPAVQEAYLAYQDKVTFVGIDIGPFTGLGDYDDGRALLADLGVTFAAGSTPDAGVMQHYRILGVPETMIFDANGALFERWTGVASDDHLPARLDELL
jgi:thiol-disulfide isomerase/thioredoxin